tara:strand:+ start:184 stop:1074 length:891 start_codon:yes stop_codon:yes gene_type:complete
MSLYSTYDQVGLKEDVSDIITDISPTDTPFFTMVKSDKVNARVFSWQEDSLASSADNKAIEGADASMATLSATTLRTNNTQILTKAFQVSATADAVATYGRAKETSYQLGKALKEIKRDLEHAYVGQSNVAVTGNDSSTAREMASADQQISTTVDAGSNSTDALTEAKLLTLGQNCFENGSDPSVFMIKPADSTIVAGFTGASGRYRNFNDDNRTLVNVVDLYVSPFGTYKIVLNRHQLSTLGFLVDPAMFRSCVLRPFSRTLLAKSGDSDKHYVVGEYSLKHMNFADSGMITGLS